MTTPDIRELQKWLNEQPNRPLDKAALARVLHELERLRAARDACESQYQTKLAELIASESENERLRAQVALPEQPTPEMLDALRTGSRKDWPSDELCRVRYAALLAAAAPAQQADHVADASKLVPSLTVGERSQPRLTVRLQSFPESNGKRNWTALLVRTEKWGGEVRGGRPVKQPSNPPAQGVGELPPLPKPARIDAVQFCNDGIWYDADQMRAYGIKCAVEAELRGYDRASKAQPKGTLPGRGWLEGMVDAWRSNAAEHESEGWHTSADAFRTCAADLERALKLNPREAQAPAPAHALTDEQADAIADAHRWDTREGRRAMLRAVQAPAVAPQKPLTDAQIEELKDDGTFYESCRGIVREIERLHGIGVSHVPVQKTGDE